MAVCIDSRILDRLVDCVEFCPFSNSDALLACGLYQLENEERQNRTGGVEIMTVSGGNREYSFQKFAAYLDDFGVLALRWISEKGIICTCSDGQLRSLKIDDTNRAVTCDITSPISESLILNLETDQSSCIIGDSKGFCSLIDLEQIRKIISWTAHDNSEVWCVEYNRSDPNLIFSGADDCLMKGWDRRANSSVMNPLYKLRHDAGVTSINSMGTDHTLWTGSYDDHLRLWDLRNTKSPVHSLNLHGGVWRIRPRDQYLLCACMYNGWCIVKYEDDIASELQMKCANTEGAALLYGVDWMPGVDGIIATSSFYDSTVKLFDVQNSISSA